MCEHLIDICHKFKEMSVYQATPALSQVSLTDEEYLDSESSLLIEG